MTRSHRGKSDAMSNEQARIILLEDQLDNATHLIEFLHGCLTDERFQYAYPDETQRRVEAIRELVPSRPGCVHSRLVTDCAACVDRTNRQTRRYWAREALGLPHA